MAKKYKTEYEKLMHGKNIARHERALAAATTGKPRRSVFVHLPQPWVWHPGVNKPWTGETFGGYRASNMRWRDQEIPSSLTLAEQLQFSSYRIAQKLAWHKSTGPTDTRYNFSPYQFDFREYPTRIKKFFLPGTGAGLWGNSEGLRPIPTQHLNIQTNTFKTNPQIYFDVEKNGFGAVEFQEL